MYWFLSIFIGILTAVVGAIGAGFVANAAVDWYHITSREGAPGYFVVFMGLVGMRGGAGPRGQGRDDGLAVWGAARAEWGTAASTDAEDWPAGQQLAAGGAVHHALYDRHARIKVCMRGIGPTFSRARPASP